MTDLFAYPNTPGYRRPGTSEDAATSMRKRAPSLRDQVLGHITRCPQTVHEVAAAMGKTVPICAAALQ